MKKYKVVIGDNGSIIKKQDFDSQQEALHFYNSHHHSQTKRLIDNTKGYFEKVILSTN